MFRYKFKFGGKNFLACLSLVNVLSRFFAFSKRTFQKSRQNLFFVFIRYTHGLKPVDVLCHGGTNSVVSKKYLIYFVLS